MAHGLRNDRSDGALSRNRRTPWKIEFAEDTESQTSRWPNGRSPRPATSPTPPVSVHGAKVDAKDYAAEAKEYVQGAVQQTKDYVEGAREYVGDAVQQARDKISEYRDGGMERSASTT